LVDFLAALVVFFVDFLVDFFDALDVDFLVAFFVDFFGAASACSASTFLCTKPLGSTPSMDIKVTPSKKSWE
jgi:hypothetical protein